MHHSLLRTVGVRIPSHQQRASCSLRWTGGSGVGGWGALQLAVRSYFVRFHSTPNDDCYKFYVDGVNFLPKDMPTMMFDRENDYQSPIAQQILHALPMVEEVTVGQNFVTVKRVEEASSEAAARYFAMRFHGTTLGSPGGMSDEQQMEAAAARSQALQQCVADATAEAEREEGTTAPFPPHHQMSKPLSPERPPATLPSDQQPFFQDGGPDTFEMGGFAVKQGSEEDETLDEAAIQQLIEAMSWSELKMHVSALLTDHMFSGEPHVSPDAPHPHADTVPCDGDSEVVLMIKELLSTTVRPQLQEDGGDIRFVRFDANTGSMEVELLGACRTCKSSKTTLVDLVERSTRHWIPEVSAVVEVGRRISAFERFAAKTAAAAAAAANGAGLSGAAVFAEADAEETETDATKIAGEGGVHKRVVVEQRASAKIVREVNPTAAEAPSVTAKSAPQPEKEEWTTSVPAA